MSNKVPICSANHSIEKWQDLQQLTLLFRKNSHRLGALFRNPEIHYKTVKFKQENGKIRTLNIPDEDLMSIQKRILHSVLNRFVVSEYATAYIRRKCLRDNALPHIGKKYLLKLDIQDFFNNINFSQVLTCVFNKNYFPKQVGYILTSLCCYKNSLPQGAPTSSYISNIVMFNFDEIIGEWCKSNSIAYTRYCDDLTFSSDKPLYYVYTKVKSMLQERGFELNENKTHFVTNNSRQSVTGITVNEKMSVSTEYKKKLRQEIYYVLKYGSSNCILYTQKSKFMNNGIPDKAKYLQHLIGKTNYILQIEPNNKQFYNARAQLISEIEKENYYESIF